MILPTDVATSGKSTHRPTFLNDEEEDESQLTYCLTPEVDLLWIPILERIVNMSSSDLRNPQLEVVAGSSLPRPKFLHNLMAPNASVSKPSYNENKSEIPPIFSRKKLSFLFPEQCAGDISHLIVNKNWLICIVSAATTSSISLLRYFLPRNRTTAGNVSGLCFII